MGGRIFICASFIILGIFLIRGSLREVEQREALKNINVNLQKEVENQTREIRNSYEIERGARLELEKVDQAKNQFIMITQHHLRTPITSIKWQLESIMNGTYGPASGELKKAMGDMSESVERLNHLINSLLSISALKAGIETLTKDKTDMNAMVEEVVKELHKEIDRRHLKVTISTHNQPWPIISIDAKRMQEVLFIFVENAVRYNIEGGNITIEGRANESKFELAIENTGIELSPEEKSKMFSELFYRSPQAQIAHPTGMGIGLSMAQAIVEAHGGSISLNSRKTGGVKALIVLPY
jgi:signal transduction histidine kinase